MDTAVFVKVRDIIVDVKAESLPIDPDRVDASSVLSELPLAMDSLEFVKMVIGLEEEFGFVADDEDFVISAMRTVGDVVRLVMARVEQNGL